MLEHDGVEQDRRQLQIGEPRDIQFDVTNDDRYVVALFENVDPETTDARSGDCQIHFQIPVELPLLLGVHQ